MSEPDDTQNAEEDEPEEPAKGQDDEEDDSGGLNDALRQKLEAFIPELVKRTFAAGMGAVFSTEEGVRRMTKEMKLPKDVAGYLVNTAANSKDELMRILAREVREFLQTVNLSEEIAKMLTMLSFEIKTEIRFIPNDERLYGVEPDVKTSARLKRADDPEADDKDDKDGGESKPRRRLARRKRRATRSGEDDGGGNGA